MSIEKRILARKMGTLLLCVPFDLQGPGDDKVIFRVIAAFGGEITQFLGLDSAIAGVYSARQR